MIAQARRQALPPRLTRGPHRRISPEARKQFALRAQAINKLAAARVVKMRTHIGAKLGDDPARALLVIGDQRAGRWFEKDEAQEIAFA